MRRAPGSRSRRIPNRFPSSSGERMLTPVVLLEVGLFGEAPESLATARWRPLGYF
jgi:hypothetical protein